jgi:uncharacterized membrane protein (Fun14 family)
MIRSCECLLIHLKNKEYFINPIVSGFVTGSLFAARARSRVAFRNVVFGGIILGCIYLVKIGMIKYNVQKEMQMMHNM